MKQFSLFTLALLAAALGCASEQAARRQPAPPVVATGASAGRELPDYVHVQVNASALGPGDVIEIRVLDEAQLSGRYEVFSGGALRFPLIGNLQVEGLDPNHVAELIASKLRDGYLVRPEVTIFIIERRSKKIFVFGEVQKPGTFPFEDSMNVIQAITMAGGFTQRAAANDTSVTRLVNGQEKRENVPVEDIGKGRSPNYLLQPGDIIYTPPSIF